MSVGSHLSIVGAIRLTLVGANLILVGAIGLTLVSATMIPVGALLILAGATCS